MSVVVGRVAWLGAVVLFVLAADLTGGVAQGRDPIDDSGYSWGMSKEAFLRLMREPDAAVPGPNQRWEILAYQTPTPEGLAIQQFTFIDGILYSFSLGMEGASDYDRAVSLITSDYGAPAHNRPVDSSHSMSTTWVLPKTEVTVAVEQGRQMKSVVIAYASREHRGLAEGAAGFQTS